MHLTQRILHESFGFDGNIVITGTDSGNVEDAILRGLRSQDRLAAAGEKNVDRCAGNHCSGGVRHGTGQPACILCECARGHK